MSAQETVEHIKAETLVDYFGQRLSDREEAEIEEHVADCEACMALARKVRRLAHAFDRWTARSHAEVLAAAGGTTALADQAFAERRGTPIPGIFDPKKSSFWPMTVWPHVHAAAEEVGKSSEKLNELILRYQKPLRTYLLHQFKSFPQVTNNADDLLQEFAAQRILAKGWLAKARQEKGRFRNFLKISLRNYVIVWGKKARLPQTSLDELAEVGMELPAPEAEEELFELDWTKQVLTGALDRMERDCEDPKHSQPRSARIWELFRLRMLDPIFKGTKPVPYHELRKRFDLKSPNEGTNMLQSAKRMFKKHLEDVIAEYEGGDAAARTEMASLTQFVSALARKM